MRTACLTLIAAGLLAGSAAPRMAADERPAAADDLERGFRETVRPFLDAYCLGCHCGEEPKGDMDLAAFATAEAVRADLARWGLVEEQLLGETMPPAKAEAHPSPEAREAILAWIDAARRYEAGRNAGDPGPVHARRLSNAEYDNTIRDLTGFDLRPTAEFPVDPANAAGFDNSSESLAMSPALVKKYLDAARSVASHLVLTPEGLAFSPHPMLADTDRDKYCVNRIIAFYNRQPTDYADYFLAAWRFRRREAAGHPDATLDALADEAGLSRTYLATIWAALNDPGPTVGPLAALRELWRDLPADDEDAARAGCTRMRDFVVDLRKQLVPDVPNLNARGINGGTQPFVLWKNRRMAANRMRYAGGAEKVEPKGLAPGSPAAAAMAVPGDPEALREYESSFEPFCRTFPDAFFVSERARVYLQDMDVGNAGRLLSAGFHSMTGYFRDDEPLSALLLDERGRAELERLWREFHFITRDPLRQYSSYLWFERAESGFLRGTEFDFVRAEDRDAASAANIRKLAKVYLAKARRVGARDEAIRAIEDQYRIISEEIRRVEADWLRAEPAHVAALQDLAERAFRRPLSGEEREAVAAFYRALREEDGLDHEDAVRDTFAYLLMSPHFLYRVDLLAEGTGGGVRPLSDHDLASRLSYFLWASMPDDELLARAEAGDLHEPEVLAGQARRMLRDKKARGLATEFAGHWLDFRRFEQHNSVDRGRFPAFDDTLRRSMFEEPVRYVLDVVQNDRSAYELLEGRHTFVNGPLARFYGITILDPGPDRWVRIDDATKYGRGGLLPMAVFLTQNSPGLRTSPVKRGYWVVKRLLGENIPAPPPDVPDLPDDEAKLGELTLREALARHRADASCASCHERFDSLGLAFEGYGPIGESRTLDLGGRPVETRVAFPNGDEGDGVAGLRAYLLSARRDEFADNLCRKLLAFGLGRTLLPSDDATVEVLRARLDGDGRFGGLIEAIVTSPQFLNKRVDGPPAE
jgi:hypothetical protein